MFHAEDGKGGINWFIGFIFHTQVFYHKSDKIQAVEFTNVKINSVCLYKHVLLFGWLWFVTIVVSFDMKCY